MITFDFEQAHRLRVRLGLDHSTGFFFETRRGNPLSRMHYLVHEVGHALSLGVRLCKDASRNRDDWNVSVLSDAINNKVSERGIRFQDHNECVVLGSDLLVFERAGYEVPDDHLQSAHCSSDISRRTFLRVLDTGESELLFARVILWLRRHGVVRGRSSRIS